MDAEIAVAAGWAAALVAAYLVLGLTLAIAEQTRAAAGRAQRLLLLYPRVVRAGLRAVAVTAIGLAGAAPTLPASATVAAGGPTPRPPVVAPARPAAEPLDWPLARTTPDRRRSPSRSRSDGYVVVQPGDCLWGLVARSLGPTADPRAVAATWPRWWAANRDVVGADPDLLHSGERLRVPPAEERSAP